MEKVLTLTVGGSCAPIVRSVDSHKPSFVHFISNADDPATGRRGTRHVIDGEGLVCGEDRDNLDLPNILEQVALAPGAYEIHELADPDDLDQCYATMVSVLSQAREQHPGAKLLADYTGGTKTMSAALVVAALNQQVELVMMRGARRNLVSVDPKTTYVHKSHISAAFLDRQLAVVSTLERRADYGAAAEAVEDVMSQHGPQGAVQSTLQTRLLLCRSFDAWDSFDHLLAYQQLDHLQNKALRRRVMNWKDALQMVIQSRARVDDDLATKASDLLGRRFAQADGFEVVRDLLANAERRASQERFDDAIGRLYRATELVAQIVLRQRYEIATHDVALVALPEQTRGKYEALCGDGARLELSMVQAHDLLADLDAGYGTLWKERRARVVDNLSTRNHSILAHGFQHIDKGTYFRIKGVLRTHVEDTLESFGADAPPLPEWPANLGDLVHGSA